MADKKTLDYYVAELRRIEQSRQEGTEKEVKKIYKELIKDLNSFLGNEYASYSNGDGVLSVAVLQEKARYAKFLQEVDQHLNGITPKISKTIRSTVENTYKSVYTGMIDAVQKSADNKELNEKLKGLSLKPEVMNRAINNPVSGLTLPDTLEKHRKEIIYNIKQQINIGLMTGERYDTMAKNVNKVISGDNGTGGLYGKAMNIVRTETHRVQESGFNDCAEEISKGLEGSGLIYTATWRTMKDKRVRPQVRVHTSKGWKTLIRGNANHQEMEGVTIKVGDKFKLESGVYTKCPGSSGTARNDCNCRCFLEYKMMTLEEFKAKGGKLNEERGKLGLQEVESDDIIKEEKVIIQELEKLKNSGMSETEYSEYLEIINNHDNSSIKKLYSEYGDKIDGLKKTPFGGAYAPTTNTIEFSYPKYADMNKYGTLAHEYGHFFDTKVVFDEVHFKEIEAINNATGLDKVFKKVASSSDEFLCAIRKDKEHIKNIFTDEIKTDLKAHNASHGVQDAIDGLFKDSRIDWGHGEKYYNRKYANIEFMDKITKTSGKKRLQQVYKDLGFDVSNQNKVKLICRQYEAASEAWANIISAEVCGGEELKYIKEYLPNSYQAMMEILKGVK